MDFTRNLLSESMHILEVKEEDEDIFSLDSLTQQMKEVDDSASDTHNYLVLVFNSPGWMTTNMKLFNMALIHYLNPVEKTYL